MSTAVQIHNGSAPVEGLHAAPAAQARDDAPRAGSVLDHILDHHEALSLGRELVPTGYLPDHIKNPQQAMAIILAGQELGMKPMRALRSLVMVKGKVTEMADSQLARFKADGGRSQFLRLDEAEAVLFLRHPNGDEHTETFTIEDARKAGLVSSGGMYQKYGKAMLRSRAITAGLKSIGWEGGVGNYDPDEALHFTPPPAPEPAPARQARSSSEERAAAAEPAESAPAPAPASASASASASAAADEVVPQCPECQGLMWDNRKSKTNPRAPDYKCRDRECEGKYWPGQWPPKVPDASQTELPVDGTAAGRNTPASTPAQAAGPCFPKNRKFPALSNIPLRDISTDDLKNVLPWLRDLGQDVLTDAITEILVERGATAEDDGLPEALKPPVDDGLPFRC